MIREGGCGQSADIGLSATRGRVMGMDAADAASDFVQRESIHPPNTMNAHSRNAVNWFELAVADLPRARRFYEAIFQCTLQVFETPEHTMAMFPFAMDNGGVGGCLTLMEGMRPGPGGTMVYLSAEGDLDGVVGRIAAAGGTVVQAKKSIGEHGFIAILRDTEGNIVGLHSYS